jgi:hypothetical protein
MKGIKVCIKCKKEFYPLRRNGKEYGTKQYNGIIYCSISCFRRGIEYSEETKKRISNGLTGKTQSIETRKKRSNSAKRVGVGRWNKGVKKPPFTEEHRKNMGLARKGEKSCNWKGGVTPENKAIRNGIEFRLWRESVFIRDSWTCQKCEQQGGYLHPHHIQNFSQYKELRFAIDNGITFCKDCHWNFHKKYGNRHNTREQIVEFLIKL